jgi:hypothetical protein
VIADSKVTADCKAFNIALGESGAGDAWLMRPLSFIDSMTTQKKT